MSSPTPWLVDFADEDLVSDKEEALIAIDTGRAAQQVYYVCGHGYQASLAVGA
jgi:hypothetical protein